MGVLLLSACTSDKDLFDAEKAAALKNAEYTTAFEKTYGKIAADQDWGFGSQAVSRAHDANSNMWPDYLTVPSVVTAEEAAKVFAHFDQLINPVSEDVQWTDFFVQHVYRADGRGNMNQLMANETDHVNNFNAALGGIMFMFNTQSTMFGYHNSADSKYHYDYIIQCIDGEYYVGLDYECTMNQIIELDGKYTDWIVKISPATYKNAQRIIAEDLGAIGDFDFNDVVFDVAKTKDNNTLITLQAAGGTLPLYIKVGDVQKEVHELFGVSENTMVNTGAGAAKAPVMFRVPGQYEAKDVAILVQDAAAIYNLKAECGKAPQKICVPVAYEWTNERQSIETKYPKFISWVGNTTIDWID